MKRAKQIVGFFLALVMLMGLFPVASIAAGDFVAYPVYGGNIYFDPATGTIVSADSEVLSAYIPSEINGVAVKTIGSHAFFESELVIVELADGITTIGESAFECCESLVSVTLPTTLTNIEPCAFSYCTELTEVEIPCGVTVLKEGAFESCISLSSITLPNTLQEIGYWAFADCVSLKSITLPASVSSIGMFAFHADRPIQIQVAPNSPYLCVENGALFDAAKRTLYYVPNRSVFSYTVPDGVTTIADGVFTESSISEIILPDTVEVIGHKAFAGCENLKNVDLPASLRVIEEAAFMGCSAMESVTFGRKLEIIGPFAFDSCTALTEVDLPDSLQVIDKYAFAECWNLKTVDMPYSLQKLGERAFYCCYELTDIIIPQGITTILPYTFYDCTNLTQATFPLSLTRTEPMAFAWCRKLTDVFYEGNQEQWKKVVRCGTSDYNYDQILRVRVHYNAAMPIPPTGTSYASAQTITIDGKAVELQAYALKDKNGYDTNYVKLRDIALLLNGTDAQFNVGWDGAVNIITDAAYTANGSEMHTPFDGDRNYELAFAKTKINGVEIDVTAILLKDDQGGGYTYYKLRDLGQALGFDVSWVQGTGITIDSNLPYTAD